MKIFAALVFSVLLSALPSYGQDRQRPDDSINAPSQAQMSRSGDAAARAAIDPVKAADIQRLIEVAGMKTLMMQSMDQMEKNIRPTLTKSLPPGAYRARLLDLFFEKFHSKINLQDFLDMAAVAYDKYFSDEDIKGLTQFYQTPLGQKTLTVLPQLSAELLAQGMRKGEEAGRDSMAEVLAEHPELERQLQEAARAMPTPEN